MNNYPHPIIAREGWPFLALAFSLFAVVYSIAKSILTWINSGMDVHQSLDARPKVTVSDKVSAAETILAEF